MDKQKWETRPLEIWARAKALRAQWQDSIDETDQILAHGNVGDVDWGVGFPRLNVIEDNPVGAYMQSVDSAFSREARLASEVRGWGREICGYVNDCWGCQFLGRELGGLPFPYRQLVVPFPDPCDQHTKRGQQCMDLSGIPRWGNDWPLYLGGDDPKRDKEMIEHKVFCTLQVINGIERAIGLEYDDEKFIETLRNREKMEEYGLEIARLMTHIPAPIGLKELYSFYTMGSLTKLDPAETLDFWKSFVDEIKWRVDNNIAAVGNERYRWMEAHPSPWHYLKYFRYMEEYGAVCVGSQYSHLGAGPIELREDGILYRRNLRAPEKSFDEVRTREDAIRYIVTEARGHRFKDDEYFRKNQITDFAKAFHVNGAIMALWRCGVGCTLTRKEQGLRLKSIGVNVLHHEGSQPGDRTDMDENRFLDLLDVWMESQGLNKLLN